MLFVPRVMRVLNEGCDLRQAARLPHPLAVLPVLDRATQGVHLVLEPLQQRGGTPPARSRSLPDPDRARSVRTRFCGMMGE
jgi:hypothetical protein